MEYCRALQIHLASPFCSIQSDVDANCRPNLPSTLWYNQRIKSVNDPFVCQFVLHLNDCNSHSHKTQPLHVLQAVNSDECQSGYLTSRQCMYEQRHFNSIQFNPIKLNASIGKWIRDATRQLNLLRAELEIDWRRSRIRDKRVVYVYTSSSSRVHHRNSFINQIKYSRW